MQQSYDMNIQNDKMTKILVVDDERENLAEISESLTEAGYKPLCSDNVIGALDLLQNDPDIGVVVTDLKMPGLSGKDLVRKVHETCGQNITFIIMTGHGSLGKHPDLPELEDFPLLRKPIDIDEFLAAVKMSVALNNKRNHTGGFDENQTTDY